MEKKQKTWQTCTSSLSVFLFKHFFLLRPRWWTPPPPNPVFTKKKGHGKRDPLRNISTKTEELLAPPHRPHRKSCDEWGPSRALAAAKAWRFFQGWDEDIHTLHAYVCVLKIYIYIYVYLCVPATVMEVPKNYSSQKLERSLRGSDASGQGDVFLNSPRSLEEWPCTQFRMDGCFIHGLEDIERHHHILRFRVQYPVLV